MNRLNLSPGATSHRLKFLRGLRPVKVLYGPGPRRDRFATDLEMSGFATGFVKEELRPRIEQAPERIQHIESLLAQIPVASCWIVSNIDVETRKDADADAQILRNERLNCR